MLVSLHPDYVMTHRLEPLAPGRTAVECPWLFAPEALAIDGFDPSFAVDFWDLTNRQDWAACEAVQRGLSSRGYRPGPLSASEDGVAQFVRLVADAYVAGGWTRGASGEAAHRMSIWSEFTRVGSARDDSTVGRSPLTEVGEHGEHAAGGRRATATGRAC